MAERTDVEILTAAADRLEHLAAATTPTAGRWNYDGPWWHEARDGYVEQTGMVSAGKSRKPVLLGVPGWARNAGSPQRAEANLRYAVAVDPTVGRALAKLLRGAVLDAAAYGYGDGDTLAVARTILEGDPS